MSRCWCSLTLKRSHISFDNRSVSDVVSIEGLRVHIFLSGIQRWGECWCTMRIAHHSHRWSSSLIINILKNGRFVSGGRSRESSPFVKASSRPRPSQPPVILADFSTYGCVSNLSYYVFCNCLKIGCMKTDKPIFSIATTASIITKASAFSQHYMHWWPRLISPPP